MTGAEICARHGVAPDPPLASEKLGAALRTVGLVPLNGVRHRPEGGTCGWYLWAGETLSEDADFFDPLHVSHVGDYWPDVLPFLSLPPGWRFLLAPGFVDVWFDPQLIEP